MLHDDLPGELLSQRELNGSSPFWKVGAPPSAQRCRRGRSAEPGGFGSLGTDWLELPTICTPSHHPFLDGICHEINQPYQSFWILPWLWKCPFNCHFRNRFIGASYHICLAYFLRAMVQDILAPWPMAEKMVKNSWVARYVSWDSTSKLDMNCPRRHSEWWVSELFLGWWYDQAIWHLIWIVRKNFRNLGTLIYSIFFAMDRASGMRPEIESDLSKSVGWVQWWCWMLEKLEK